MSKTSYTPEQIGEFEWLAIYAIFNDEPGFEWQGWRWGIDAEVKVDYHYDNDYHTGTGYPVTDFASVVLRSISPDEPAFEYDNSCVPEEPETPGYDKRYIEEEAESLIYNP